MCVCIIKYAYMYVYTYTCIMQTSIDSTNNMHNLYTIRNKEASWLTEEPYWEWLASETGSIRL